MAKNTKTYTSKLNLKAKNIQIELLLKPSKTNHGLKLLLWVEIGWVKISLNGEILPNLVTLATRLCRHVPQKEGVIQVLVGLAPPSLTVGSLLRIQWLEKIDKNWVPSIDLKGKMHLTTFDQTLLGKSKIWHLTSC